MNIQSSLSSFSVILMAHAAHSFVGRFRTLLFSTTAYIGGLMLFWMFNPYDVKWLVVVALVLLALGTSGANVLRDVLIDLVHDIDKSEDRTKTRSIARATIWLRIAGVLGVISAILWVATDALGGVRPSWRSSFMICIITITTVLMIFCKGHNVYHQDALTERPVEIFFRVFRARIQKLLKVDNSRCSTNTLGQDRSLQQNLGIEMTTNEGIAQERSVLRLNMIGLEDRESSSYKQEDMVVIKRLLRMFPMWGVFMVVCVISATGNTFFLQQYSYLNPDKIPIQIYNLVQDSSSFLIPFLYRAICDIRWISSVGKNEKVKIGVGMIFAIISCVSAWQLEVHRLKAVKTLPEDENTSISFLWLVPQFCMLGCMEGLTGEGLLNFYKSQIKDEPIRSYGEEYIEIVHGFGKLLNIFLILLLKSQREWFGDTINESRVDKYYRLLIYACSTNFIIYCCTAKFFYKDTEQHQNSDSHDLQHDYRSG
ncbi:hypothetical protein Ccrd_002904 [Cynara cardunculus var. scolymus]|uniref:Major facilitator superfamily domain, general substrate transporter n=2 Tax=Cynara cardunculus var. scolymus TaxID=59895 RepID=A0A103XQG8_CYNCS|nr:hypothetical protein Ccrd_002904 [Cynara cardunculus var. scolymus]